MAVVWVGAVELLWSPHSCCPGPTDQKEMVKAMGDSALFPHPSPSASEQSHATGPCNILTTITGYTLVAPKQEDSRVSRLGIQMHLSF